MLGVEFSQSSSDSSELSELTELSKAHEDLRLRRLLQGQLAHLQGPPDATQTYNCSNVLESLGSLGSWVNKEQHIWPVAAPYASHELEWASVDEQIQRTAELQLFLEVSCDLTKSSKLCVQFLRFQLCIHLGFGLSL